MKARQLEAAAEDNAILRALPPEELDRLRPFLRYTPLTVRQRLSSTSEPLTQLWFPIEGAVSRLVHLPAGETVEAGIVGNDGAIGLPLALGGNHWLGVATVQIGGTAFCISAADFEEHVRAPGSPLALVLLRYANLYISVLSQLTACHALHRIEQRLSRCILTLLDYSAMPAVQITHDTLADFLGVHRPSVTYALQSIAESGAIVSERRRIVVRDRQALLSHSCECYTAIRTSTDRELQAMGQLRRRG